VVDVQASLGDTRALISYVFQPERFQRLGCPLLLQIGSKSPRELYITDALAPFLTEARIESLEGQAHEALPHRRSMPNPYFDLLEAETLSSNFSAELAAIPQL
jgi:hypothetical protein